MPSRPNWKDSAAACAALFLNLYYLERWHIPWTLAFSPLELLAFAVLAGAVLAAAFYLVSRGAAGAALDGLPLDSAVGRLVYGVVLIAFAGPLSAACTATISWAFFECFAAIGGLPALPREAAAHWAVPLLLIGWAAWVASRGRAVVARSTRLWVWACMALLLGSCIRFWREIVAVVSSDAQRFRHSDFAGDLEAVLAVTLPLSLFAGLLRPAPGQGLGRAAVLGPGAGLAAALVLASLSLAGVSLVVYDGDMLRFHIIARSAAGSYGEARLLLVTLALLPLLRIGALALSEAFRSVGAPAPALIAFATLSLFAMAAHARWPLWEAEHEIATLAGCLSGVLSGKGAADLLWPAIDTAKGRVAEGVGLAAALGFGAALYATLGSSMFMWQWGGPIVVYLVGLAATLAVSVALRLKPLTPGVS